MGLLFSSQAGGGAGTRPGEGEDKTSWWFKFGAKAMGSIGGVIAMATGVVACISFSATCIVAGVLQMLFGFLCITMEAPCCCMWLDFIDKLASFSEKRPYWLKALVYIGTSILPMILCFELTTIFGNLLILLTGVMYGVLALGKKAPVSEMMATAGGGRNNDGMETSIVDKDRNPVVPEV